LNLLFVDKVVCYAYTQFVQAGTGNIKSFLKVEDGWNRAGRYIDAALKLGPTNDGVKLETVHI